MIKTDYTVQEIIDLTIDERMALPRGGLRLTFPNGDVKVFKTTTTILSAFYWELADTWPGVILTPEHHMGNGNFTVDTHLSLGANVFWSTFFAHPEKNQHLVWDMSRKIYEITNKIYIFNNMHLLPYVCSMSIDDMMDIVLHPITVKAKKRYEDKEIDLETCHDLIYELMTGDYPELKDNEVRKACSAGILSKRQIKQMIGPRGTIPDIDSSTFPHPVIPGYMEGLSSFYDQATEARTSSIAIYATTGPLELSEYNNRQCQLGCSVIQEITYGDAEDCGSTHYSEVLLDNLILSTLSGKNGINPETGEKHLFTGKETKWLNKVVKLRTIDKCLNKDTQSMCLTCLGLTGLIVPPGTNAGSYLSIEPQSEISQTILGVKHVIANAIALSMDISGNRCDFFEKDIEDQFIIYLKEQARPLKMRVHKDEVAFINDVFQVEDVKELTISRVSEVSSAQFFVLDDNGSISNIQRVDCEVSGKGNPLTHEFLEYIKGTRWKIVGKNVEFDLKDWDFNKPFLKTNPVSEDILNTFNAFKTFLHAPEKSTAIRITDFTRVEDAVMALANILSPRVKINYAHLEIFVRPLMCKGLSNDVHDRSFALPAVGDEFRFMPLKTVISERSLGAALAYQEQAALLTDPSTFNRAHKVMPSTPLDARWSDTGLMPLED